MQSVEVVLTAHPTQVMRRSVQHKQCRVAQLLQDLEKVEAVSGNKDEIISALFREVRALFPFSFVQPAFPIC